MHQIAGHAPAIFLCVRQGGRCVGLGDRGGLTKWAKMRRLLAIKPEIQVLATEEG